MKTITELDQIRQRVKKEIAGSGTRVAVGMATCGIAAGSTPVLAALQQEIAARKLTDVKLAQVGCMGLCKLEPLVEVMRPGQPKITYTRVTPEMVAKIVDEHLAGGKPVQEYMIQEI